MPQNTSKIQTHISQQTIATLTKYYQQRLDIPVTSLAHLGEMVFHDFLEMLLETEEVELIDTEEEQEELMVGLVLASRGVRRHTKGVSR